MEDIPEHLLRDILKRVTSAHDRSSLSLVSKYLYSLESNQREFIRVGRGLDPASQALTSLCTRFPNLIQVEIDYSGWMSSMGKQLDNEGLHVLSLHCPSLKELILSFCSFIDDSGLGYLAFCKKLRSLKLNFAPAVSSHGLLSVVAGCKNLSALHLIRCMKVGGAEWLGYVGKLGSLEELTVKNCRGVSEDEIIKLGSGWNRLRWLHFERDPNHYRYVRTYSSSLTDWWEINGIKCDSLIELRLVKCILEPGLGMASLLGKCAVLQKLQLDACIGVKDVDLIALARASRNLKSLSLRSILRLNDACLQAIAENCSSLQTVELCFSDGEVPCFSDGEVPMLNYITQDGLLTMIRSCPIRVLVLEGAEFFNDDGMVALRFSNFLETLEIVKCQVSDAGVEFAAEIPCLRNLRLCRCLGVTDAGLAEFMHSQKLETIVVQDCPWISMQATQRAARSFSYKQDLSWLF